MEDDIGKVFVNKRTLKNKKYPCAFIISKKKEIYQNI